MGFPAADIARSLWWGMLSRPLILLIQSEQHARKECGGSEQAMSRQVLIVNRGLDLPDVSRRSRKRPGQYEERVIAFVEKRHP